MRTALLALLALAVVAASVVAKGGGSSSSDSRRPIWEPSPTDRWQYQLESSNRHLASTGGIDVCICQRPHSGGHCVRPDVFDIDLYVDGQVSGNKHTIDTEAVRRDPQPRRPRGLLHVSGHRRALSSRLFDGTSRSTKPPSTA